MQERGWGALSAKDRGKGILPGTVNKQARWPERLWWEWGQGAHPATKSGKAGESGRGRKTPQERREDPLPM
jgi:hypothetical protein